MGEGPVKRRNVHEHPDADEDEVNDYLQATIARLDRERAPRGGLVLETVQCVARCRER